MTDQNMTDDEIRAELNELKREIDAAKKDLYALRERANELTDALDGTSADPIENQSDTTSPRADVLELLRAEDSESGVSREAIIECCADRGEHAQTDIESVLTELKKKGEIYQPSDDTFRAT